MSVDYEASWGIGYEVCESDELEGTEELEDGLVEYIYCERGKEFDSFETGSAYTGHCSGVYLIVKDPFKDGLDLTKAKERLDAEVARLKLKVNDCEFGEVGGLFVC